MALFAVGAGGNPERHLPLLKLLAEHNCTVVAPHFDRLVALRPTEDQLLLRARRLSLALDSVAGPELPVAGVGHSIGATILLALAGGLVWLGPGYRLSIAPEARLDRLALMAPATGFFQAPGALDAVRTAILAWVGTEDAVTPPSQASLLKHLLMHQVLVEVRVVEGAGHFSFMDELPPEVKDTLCNREEFLGTMARDICRFLTTQVGVVDYTSKPAGTIEWE